MKFYFALPITKDGVDLPPLRELLFRGVQWTNSATYGNRVGKTLATAGVRNNPFAKSGWDIPLKKLVARLLNHCQAGTQR